MESFRSGCYVVGGCTDFASVHYFFASRYTNCVFYLPWANSVNENWIEIWIWSRVENDIRFFILFMITGECSSCYLDDFLQFCTQLLGSCYNLLGSSILGLMRLALYSPFTYILTCFIVEFGVWRRVSFHSHW